jgi:hypothetical protein
VNPGAAAGGWLLAVCASTLLAACSQASRPGPVSAPQPAIAAAAATCSRRALKAADVGHILTAPITQMHPMSGDAQTCEFSTAGFPAVTISVRPGVGRSIVDAWLGGKMPLKASPLAGVGDAAVWQASLHEVIAQKHDLLCDIAVRGDASDIAVPVTDLPTALGALCNRLFAAG